MTNVTRDYHKDTPHEQFSWVFAAPKLFNGYCLRRASWPEGDYIFMVKSATYTAVDWTSGIVENFLVKKAGLKEFIFMPDEERDLRAQDWQVYTRQETHSFPRYEGPRETRPAGPEIEIIDYPVGGSSNP